MKAAITATRDFIRWDNSYSPFHVLGITKSQVFIVTGLLLGLLGALPPAIRCLKPPLPIALRMA